MGGAIECGTPHQPRSARREGEKRESAVWVRVAHELHTKAPHALCSCVRVLLVRRAWRARVWDLVRDGLCVCVCLRVQGRGRLNLYS